MPRSPRLPSTYVDLTVRELEVVAQLKDGLSTEDIAAKLFISPATVRNHLANIFTKTDTHSRLEAVAFINSEQRLRVQHSTILLTFMADQGLPVSDEHLALIHDEFTCDHECAVHPRVPAILRP